MLDSPPISSQILLVGPQAHILGPMLVAGGGRLTSAQSLLEAILISHPAVWLILVDVAPETDHLESAIRSLRDVNPDAYMILLSDPADESACRRALAWGADQYEIVPLDGRTEQSLLPRAQVRSPRAAPPPESPPLRIPLAGTPRSLAEAATSLPAIPLMVQTGMLEEILEGVAVRTDFAQRATEALKRNLGIKGSLRFQPGEASDSAPSNAHEFHREVSFTGQAPFGELVWQPDAAASPASTHEAATLAQAANWLGAMLALSQRYDQLRTMAITDELSGAYNRRYFTKFMSGLLERAKENRFRVTLMLFDIDDFKKYNDQFGHASGDAIIRELVKLLRICTRAHDLVARLGGDEFAVVYWDNEAPRQPNSDHPKDVLVATERFREAIKNHRWPETCKIKGTISISGGLATFPWHARSLDTLMAKADEALLQAKVTGKNVIVMNPPAIPEPTPPAVRAS